MPKITAIVILALTVSPYVHGWVISPTALLGPIAPPLMPYDDLRLSLTRSPLLDPPTLWSDADQSLDRLDRLINRLLPDEEFGSSLFPLQLRTPLRDLIDSSFDDKQLLELRPKFEVKETDNGLLLTAATPGLNKEDLSVEVIKKDKRGTYLVISGQSKKEEGTPLSKDPKDEADQKEGQIQNFRKSIYQFEKSIRLPDGIDPSSITSKYADGMLQVQLNYADQGKMERQKIAIN